MGADLLDAIHAVEVAETWAYVDLATVSNDLRTMTYLGEILLDRHKPVDGVREAWSVQDAVDRWGVERVDRGPVWEDDESLEEDAAPVAEWGNPIVGGDDAEAIAGSAATLRRWVRQGLVAPLPGEISIAGRVTRLYRRAELIETRDRLRVKQQSGLVQNDPARGGTYEDPAGSNHTEGSTT